MRRLVLALGLMLGIAGAATLPRQGVIAWQHLLIDAQGAETACPTTLPKGAAISCAVVSGDQAVFRSLVALQPYMQQVQAWKYDAENDTYSGRFRIDKRDYGMAVEVQRRGLYVALGLLKSK